MKHPCAKRVWDRYRGYHPCQFRGVLFEADPAVKERSSQWWCRRHAPSTVKARRDAADARAAGQQAARDVAARQRALEAGALEHLRAIVDAADANNGAGPYEMGPGTRDAIDDARTFLEDA